MKKLLLVLVMVNAAISINAQDFPKMDKSPLDFAYYPTDAVKRGFKKTDEEKIAGTPKMRVIYSRPQKKEREVFGKLVEYNKEWRLGANETTEIDFFTDVEVGGSKLTAGRYTMICVPTEKEWTIKFSKDLDYWGAYTYNPKNDVASITVPTQKVSAVIESFSIVLHSPKDSIVHIKMGWDMTVVEVPVTLK